MLAKMNLSKNEYRVLFMLQSMIGYKNLLYINKTKLAEEFKCDRVMVSKTVSMLDEFMDELTSLKSDFSLTCVKKDWRVL